MSFSRDGNSLYYVFSTGTTPPAMYTMPVLGGNARKVAELSGMGFVSLSPDEKRLAFRRRVSDDHTLFVANLYRSGERPLSARSAPDELGPTAWSPDGKIIAYGVSSRSGGISTWLAANPWKVVPRRASVRASGPGLAPCAGCRRSRTGCHRQRAVPLYQVWHVSYPEARREPSQTT
jgi:hypothetical protein